MSAGLVQTYRAFAHNNAWANHRLLNACAALSQDDFEAARTSFFPSLQLTLNHIYVIDLFYVDAIEGGRPSCPFCGQPLDPAGHICPRANGYRR